MEAIMANHRNRHHINPALEEHYGDLALSGLALSGIEERENPRPKKGENSGLENSYASFADDLAERTGQFK
jgi:hypothetical protein